MPVVPRMEIPPTMHGNDHRQAARVVCQAADLLYIFPDHLTGDGIDGSRPHRLVQARLRNPSHAPAAVDGDARCLCIGYLRIDQGAFCHIRVIAAVFFDGAGNPVVMHVDLMHFQVQRDPLWRNE